MTGFGGRHTVRFLRGKLQQQRCSGGLGILHPHIAPMQPRLMLPLSLSYDHRVINGAAAARFTKRLGDLLAEIRSLLL